MDQPVFVTKSTLPPVEEYLNYVRDIFDTHQLTNQGKYVAKLEKELCAVLDSPAVPLVANGTLALQLAIRLLGLAGKKVITTPFTYVATVSALLWEGCEPVFADIDQETFCIAPGEVEKQLEKHPDTAGILPVHVFGNAPDVRKIAEIASQRKLQTLYDASHAIGCKLDGKSLFTYGDAATGSFHATKIFHTVEGGCIAVRSAEAAKKIGLLRSFGHIGDHHETLGINAKMSELHAAMGLCLLPRLADTIKNRAKKTALYDKLLKSELGGAVRSMKLAKGLIWNHSYYPIVFESEVALQRALAALAEKNIHPRRYFYPSLTKLPYLPGQSCPVSDSIANRILCLPLWAEMDDRIIEETVEAVKASL